MVNFRVLQLGFCSLILSLAAGCSEQAIVHYDDALRAVRSEAPTFAISDFHKLVFDGNNEISETAFFTGTICCTNHSPRHCAKSLEEMKKLSDNPPGCAGFRFHGLLTNDKEIWLLHRAEYMSSKPSNVRGSAISNPIVYDASTYDVATMPDLKRR